MIGDAEFLAMAYDIASRSPDPSNQNGAVIVIDQRPIFRDCNRFPTNFKFDESFLTDRDKKLQYIEHAERTTVFGAAKCGISTHGAIMYCPWFACMECARAIIFSGIAEVVGHAERMVTTPERWRESVEKALKYLDENNVRVRFASDKIGGPQIRVNGELWQP